jgi:hypothetical protein
VKREAATSLCGKYRYHLARDWSEGEVPRSLLFVMLNPSTADAHVDDRTIGRCVGFALAERYTRVDVVNLFAYRTPHPSALKTQWEFGVDVVGPDNDNSIRHYVTLASGVVVAWGAFDPGVRLRKRYDDRKAKVLELVQGRPLFGLGDPTKDGSPRHPLFVKATERLQHLRRLE